MLSHSAQQTPTTSLVSSVSYSKSGKKVRLKALAFEKAETGTGMGFVFRVETPMMASVSLTLSAKFLSAIANVTFLMTFFPVLGRFASSVAK